MRIHRGFIGPIQLHNPRVSQYQRVPRPGSVPTVLVEWDDCQRMSPGGPHIKLRLDHLSVYRYHLATGVSSEYPSRLADNPK